MLGGFGRRRGEGLGRFGNVSEGLVGYGKVWTVLDLGVCPTGRSETYISKHILNASFEC